MSKQIFIGGTGRSGTTVLSRYLGTHKDISKMPFETRFIIDHGGLMNLFDALTSNYSVEQSRMAIKDFRKLMYSDLCNNYNSPYLYIDFPKAFGENTYFGLLDKFMTSIQAAEFKAGDYQTPDKYKIINYFVRKYFGFIRKNFYSLTGFKDNGGKSLPFYKWPEEQMHVGRYFSDKEDLLQLMSSFTNDLYLSHCHNMNTIHWCEDTPSNMAHLKFLSKLYKDAYFIHMVRNPIGVAFSMKNMGWAPDNYKDIVSILKSSYKKLRENKIYAEKNKLNYLELRLEDISTEFDHWNQRIIKFLEISDSFTSEIILDIKKVDYYKDQLSDKDYQYLKDELSEFIDYYGYS